MGLDFLNSVMVSLRVALRKRITATMLSAAVYTEPSCIYVFSYTILNYSDGSVEKVWLYDGNIKFLEGKHVPLFIISLTILVVLSIFYTLPL